MSAGECGHWRNLNHLKIYQEERRDEKKKGNTERREKAEKNRIYIEKIKERAKEKRKRKKDMMRKS